MKVYVLNLTYYYNEYSENEVEVFSTLEGAVQQGMSKLNSCIVDLEDYTFEIIETDPEYAENFNVKELDIDIYDENSVGKYEPTQIYHYYNFDGILKHSLLAYEDRHKESKFKHMIKKLPEDEFADAGKKFKVGDIVRVNIKDSEDYTNVLVQYATSERMYVVRWLPRRVEGQKYFENTYALVSYYDEDKFKGLYTIEFYERDIEKVEEKIEMNSPIGFLSGIIKQEIKISDEIWNELKLGNITLTDGGSYTELEEYKNLNGIM